MSKKGQPRNPKWSPGEVVALRLCAERGLSMKDAATVVGRSHSAVMQMAQRLEVSFHGKMGAPKGNTNRKIGELKKQMRAVIEQTNEIAYRHMASE